MTLLDLIRNRLTSRAADAATSYWATIEKIASGKFTDRTAEDAAEDLEALIPALGKTHEDIDADVELLTRLRALGDADAQVQAAQDATKDAVRRAAALTQQAEAARAEAKRLDAAADTVRRQAESRVAVARQAASDARDLQRQLAQRGHTTIAARIEREADDRRNADALRQAELDLAAIDEEQRSTESYLPTARHPDAVLRQVETLKAKRAAAAKLVEELRAAVPTEAVQ
jgi:hypothetical protein